MKTGLITAIIIVPLAGVAQTKPINNLVFQFNGAPPATPGLIAADSTGLAFVATIGPSLSYNPSTGTLDAIQPITTGSSPSWVQITSTAATGMPPFAVSSTTNVANLNASLLLGGTWASPGAIGSTTPNAGAFTTLGTSGKITQTSAGIGTTSTQGVLLQNTAASTSGSTVQYAPNLTFIGHAWNTSGTPADNYLQEQEELRPSSGSGTSSVLYWSFSDSATSTPSYTDLMSLASNGNLNIYGQSLAVNYGSGYAGVNFSGSAPGGNNAVYLNFTNTYPGNTSYFGLSEASGQLATTGSAVPSYYAMVMGPNGSPLYFMANGSNSVVGSVTTSGSTTSYNTSSDERMKENFKVVTGALADMEKIQVWDYDFIRTKEKGRGFKAQDLAAIVPQAVTPGDGNPSLKEGDPGFKAWSIDYSKLVPLLVAALQEQQKEIDQLKESIAALAAAPKRSDP